MQFWLQVAPSLHVRAQFKVHTESQVAPAAQSMSQPPPLQSTVQLEFSAHVIEQSPSGHSKAHEKLLSHTHSLPVQVTVPPSMKSMPESMRG